MLQLILKDFRVNWMFQLLSLAACFGVCAFSTSLMQDDGGQLFIGLYLIIVILCCSGASLLFMRIDDLYNADEIYASLPVTRKQIVQARYFTSFVQIVCGLVFCLLAVWVGAFFQESLDDPALQVIYHPALWLFMLTILLLLNSFSYPFYFRLGFIKGAAAIGITQLSMITIGYFLYKWLKSTGQLEPLIRKQLEWITNQNDTLLLIGLLSFIFLACGGSVWLSGNFYKNKDI